MGILMIRSDHSRHGTSVTGFVRLAIVASAFTAACVNDAYLPREPESNYLDPTLAMLYAKDPLRNSYDFDRADYGRVIQDDSIKNRGSHITYGTYASEGFSVGVQGGEPGSILDLGTDAELAQRIGVQETVGGGEGFAGLTLEGETFNDPTAAELFTMQPAIAASATVSAGHVYVLRIVRKPEKEIRAKILVVAHVPGDSVVFEWIRWP